MTAKTIPGRERGQRCRVCLCSDREACPAGCWWVKDPLREGPLCNRCRPAEKVIMRIRRAVANSISLGVLFAAAMPEGSWERMDDEDLAAGFISSADDLISELRDERRAVAVKT